MVLSFPSKTLKPFAKSLFFGQTSQGELREIFRGIALLEHL
jgi:hypothetical protein